MLETQRDLEMKLQEKIKHLRKQHGLSQSELAEKVGVHTGHISRLETGKYQPSIDILKNLAHALEVTTDYLLNEDEGDLSPISVESKTWSERIRLIDTLDSSERNALLTIIDALLTKKKVIDLVTGQNQSTPSQ